MKRIGVLKRRAVFGPPLSLLGSHSNSVMMIAETFVPGESEARSVSSRADLRLRWPDGRYRDLRARLVGGDLSGVWLRLPSRRYGQRCSAGQDGDFDACGYLAKQTGLQLDPEELRARRGRRKLELVAAQPLMPGIAGYLRGGANAAACTLGVASSSSRGWVAGHLDRLGVADLFDAIVTGDDVAHVEA